MLFQGNAGFRGTMDWWVGDGPGDPVDRVDGQRGELAALVTGVVWKAPSMLVNCLGRLIWFVFQTQHALLAWSIRSVCLLAPEPARACLSVKCVSSNVWTAVAALVINFPLHLQTRGPASALGFGERDEGHLCFSLMAVIRGLLFSFFKVFVQGAQD